jgi:tetratricopeptide (TPR) repeat protein
VKRLFVLICSLFILNACGNPSVVAYMRGIAFQSEAEKARKEAGKVDNKVESKYFQAIEQYNSALHFDPNLDDAYYRRGNCRAAIGQYDAATEDFTQVSRLKPADPKGWAYKANAEMMQQKYADAIADFNASDSLSPGAGWIYNKRAYCKMYTGDPKGALSDAKKLVEVSPTGSDYCLLAIAQRVNGNLVEMDKAYAKALKANPHDETIYQNRAFSNFILGRYDPAVKDFESVLKLSDWRGDQAPYAVLLSVIAARLNKDEPTAKRILDESIVKMEIPTEVDKHAHNARVSNDWPVPIIQYLHNDITKEKYIRSAQGDIGKETEVNCYLGLEALVRGNKAEAQKQFNWVLTNGRRDYIEWDIAKRLASGG